MGVSVVGGDDLVLPAFDGVEQGQLGAGVRAFAADQESGAGRPSGGVENRMSRWCCSRRDRMWARKPWLEPGRITAQQDWGAVPVGVGDLGLIEDGDVVGGGV